jgi:phospholipid transport system transporter-binding protein
VTTRRTCALEALGEGRFAVAGDLDFETAADLLECSLADFKDAPRIEADLSAVRSSDSAGLALLIEWVRLARARGIPIEFHGIPAQLRALIGISELEALFPDSATQHAAGDQGESVPSSSSPQSSSRSSGSSGGLPS